MIENVIIFSKEKAAILLATNYDKIIIDSQHFEKSLDAIKQIAYKLEKGVFKLELEKELSVLIFAIKRISTALIFKCSFDKLKLNEWEQVAKDIATGFDKIYNPTNIKDKKYLEYKEKVDDIINWQLKELSPIEKLKDALW